MHYAIRTFPNFVCLYSIADKQTTDTATAAGQSIDCFCQEERIFILAKATTINANNIIGSESKLRSDMLTSGLFDARRDRMKYFCVDTKWADFDTFRRYA